MQRGEIGKRLRNLRKVRGVSQEWVARKVFVSRKTVSKYECGGGIDADLADAVLRSLGAVCVLGAQLNEEESRMVLKYIESIKQKEKETISCVKAAF